MPNYVTNVIICKENLLSKILNADHQVDFSILIPEPTTKEQLISEYGENYVDNGDKHLDHKNTPEWFDWYSWNCDFWGTKWNAMDTDVKREDGLCFVQFDTAWSPPTAWIDKLASLGQPFILHWEEEQGYGGYEGYNGATAINGSFDIPEYDENGDPIIDDEEDRELPASDTLKDFFGDK